MSDTHLHGATGLYTTSEVEQRTGVPATTLRQWERRYQIPLPTRNESGYRLYSAADLAHIEFLLARLAEGISISRAAQLCREHFASTGTGDAGAHDPGHDLVADLVAALLAPDHTRAATLLSEAHARLTVEDVLTKVIAPALGEIGEQWERGEITVAHEHGASAFLRARVASLLDLTGGGNWGPSVVAACGPHEQHEIGLLMVSVVLRRLGVRVHYLGPNTPLGDLAVYARAVDASGVLVSVNTAPALYELRAQRHDLRDLGMPLFLGGSVFNARPELAQEVGGIYLGADAVRCAQALVAYFREGHANTS